MARTILFTHKACIAHDPGLGHPERPDRLRAVLERLDQPAFAALERREAPLASRAMIARVHDAKLVGAILEAVPKSGHVALDADTHLSPQSGEAALRAAGALIAAVDAVFKGEADNAFCAVRPPGHHAEPARPMGFCLFNNVAIGAAHARAAHGLRRVAILDFDVHHGNGTQAYVEPDADLFFASSHQWPLYPGTGAASEVGVGNVVNLPLRAMSGSAEFRAAWADKVFPALNRFAPELVMISAGFDAHRDDPLGGLQLVEADYGWITTELARIAKAHAKGRLVSTLEGGYDLAALAASAAAHVTALMAA
ncbi:MAG: histone deacetylase family protein [Alphaproteobacteria bacterium]|nr:histone deacetylase family protein [Alphaproteobacteria bacterium]